MQPNRPQTMTIHGVVIKKSEDVYEMRLAPFFSGWVVPLTPVVLLILVGVAMLVTMPNGSAVAVFFLLVAAALLIGNPVQNDLTLNSVSRRLFFRKVYGLRWPFKTELDLPLNQVVSASRGGNRSDIANRVELRLADGSRIWLYFGKGGEDADRLLERLLPFIKQAEDLPSAPAVEADPNADNDMDMQLDAEPPASPVAPAVSAVAENVILTMRGRVADRLRRWSIWIILSGALGLFRANGFSSEGVAVILVALVAFVLAETPMFIVFTAIIAWAGIQNLVLSDGLLKLVSLVQFFMAYLMINNYRDMLKMETRLGTLAQAGDGAEMSKKLFPWVALGLGAISFLGYFIVFAVIFVNIFVYDVNSSPIFDVLMDIFLASATLGMAFGLAGWVCRLPKKWASILGFALAVVPHIISMGLHFVH